MNAPDKLGLKPMSCMSKGFIGRGKSIVNVFTNDYDRYLFFQGGKHFPKVGMYNNPAAEM